MKVDTLHAINGYALLIMGFWTFHASKRISPDADYPALMLVMIGILLLIMSNGVRFRTRPHIYIAAVLTIAGLAATSIKPLPTAVVRGDAIGIARMIILLLTGVSALVAITRSILSTRK